MWEQRRQGWHRLGSGALFPWQGGTPGMGSEGRREIGDPQSVC